MRQQLFATVCGVMLMAAVIVVSFLSVAAANAEPERLAPGRGHLTPHGFSQRPVVAPPGLLFFISFCFGEYVNRVRLSRDFTRYP